MKHINVHEFKTLLEKEGKNPEMDFINVCTTPEYDEKHIPGVRSVPLDTLESHLNEFGGKKAIYIHCRSGNRGKQAIEKLEKLGVKAELVNVEGGILAWDKLGFTTAANSNRMPLMRQVLLAAGSLVTLGVVLAMWVNPLFVFLSLFVGMGLMFAGATGWCGMSYLLAMMPWNKD